MNDVILLNREGTILKILNILNFIYSEVFLEKGCFMSWVK